ncbi:Hypothetical_protein [Hexamita inflata]|uniref:Hypothetical_protein n=1 Tax=Hexamita inflata TaxID=28002 RepID=A0AA86UYB3_9EUKA|nr:Hypothetical protein HINF_LOCUS57044 [Hexamita inflata]CAI9969401.1 Hypothetical protein HINF_LOCUS57046 [Hexamita inflata]
MRRESYSIYFVGIVIFQQVLFRFYRYLLPGLPGVQICSGTVCQLELLLGFFFEVSLFVERVVAHLCISRDFVANFSVEGLHVYLQFLQEEVTFLVQRAVFANYNWYNFSLVSLVVLDLCLIVLFFVPRDSNVQVDSFASVVYRDIGFYTVIEEIVICF